MSEAVSVNSGVRSRCADSGRGPRRLSRRSWLLLALGLITCVTIHVAALEFRGTTGLTSRDSVQYWRIGVNVADGHGFSYDGVEPTRMRQPIYPLMIATVVSLSGETVWPVQLLQLLVALLTVIVTAAIARELFGGRIAGLAGLVAGLYYPFAVMATEIRTESLFILLIGGAALTGLRAIRVRSGWWAASCGLLLGLAALTRSSGLVFIALTPPATWAVLRGRQGAWRQPLLIFTVAIISLMPWGGRNYIALGQFTVRSLAGPASVYQGTHPLAVEAWARDVEAIEATEEFQQLLGDGPYLAPDSARRFRAAVVDRVREDPVAVATRGLIKIGLAWTYAPGSRPLIDRSPMLFQLLRVPQIALLLLMAYGVSFGDRRTWWFAAALFVATTASIVVGVALSRYTFAFMPVGLALAACGATRLANRIRTASG